MTLVQKMLEALNRKFTAWRKDHNKPYVPPFAAELEALRRARIEERLRQYPTVASVLYPNGFPATPTPIARIALIKRATRN